MIDRPDSTAGSPPEVQRILAELARGEFADLAEAQAFLERRLMEYNTRPQAVLGGLSPLAAFELMDGDWVTSGPLRLNTALAVADVLPADIFVNARTLLTAAAEAGSIKATAAGNLNRRFVREMLEACRWPARFVQSVWRVNKVVNERDVLPLHVLRLVLDLAGLLKRRKGAFTATGRGRKLLEEERAGDLYSVLFLTFFQRFNLGYLDRLPEVPGLQATVAFTLYRLRDACTSWVRPEALTEAVVLESVREEIPVHPMFDPADLVLETRILTPLVTFGLLERRDLEPGPLYHRPFEVRKTTLYDRFLRFEWGQEA